MIIDFEDAKFRILARRRPQSREEFLDGFQCRDDRYAGCLAVVVERYKADGGTPETILAALEQLNTGPRGLPLERLRELVQ
jgi:hypothetical protein